MVGSTFDRLLKEIIARKIPVSVFLVNGVRLQGIVEAYDEEGLVLRYERSLQLVFRSAISTLVPQQGEWPKVSQES